MSDALIILVCFLLALTPFVLRALLAFCDQIERESRWHQ